MLTGFLMAIGRPMRIAFADLPSALASVLPINRRIQPGRQQDTGNIRNNRRPGDNNRRQRGGNTSKREKRPTVTQADLDADMDSYMAVGKLLFTQLICTTIDLPFLFL
jgi:THO complex subunit 4